MDERWNLLMTALCMWDTFLNFRQPFHTNYGISINFDTDFKSKMVYALAYILSRPPFDASSCHILQILDQESICHFMTTPQVCFPAEHPHTHHIQKTQNSERADSTLRTQKHST